MADISNIQGSPMSPRGPKRHFAAVRRYGRCRWNTGRSVDEARTVVFDPKRTTASCFSRLSRQGRNHHNFNEHPRSPKVRGEASPHRRICRIDPFIPNRIVIFEQTHVSDPDLRA
jgi:hypothetical protein